ncbi:MAG: (d)CMP kinase [Flavobacteriales bacterium]|nr:(d)CMP kinase [Flavobacteriales bacterium]
MTEPRLIIAIDGHSSCGKSTLAKALAKEFRLTYVDTGAMYRAATLHALEQGWLDQEPWDETSFINELDNLDIRLEKTNDGLKVLLQGRDVSDEIRTMKVSEQVSKVSAVMALRKKMISMQREMANDHGVVMDGRDIGTAVFPDANLKIFMTATPEERASRRMKELQQKNIPVTYQEVLDNIVARDHADSTRLVNPLVKAPDAVVLDNTSMTQEEQFNLARAWVKKKYAGV